MSSRAQLVPIAILLAATFAVAAPPAAPTAPATQPASSWCAKIVHAPPQPKSGQPVHVSASIAPGISAVQLQYQVIEPGQYVELKDAEYAKNWTTLDMTPAAPDAKGRTPFAADLPATLQKHRRLVRYRVIGKDAAGKPLLAPMFPAVPAEPNKPAQKEAPSNAAYFVYDGVPPWTGAVNPKGDARQKQPTTFTPEALTRAQVYHLIAKRSSVENVTWKEQQGGREYKYTGTLVTPDGEARDHVRFRARGGTWRFAMGKNMWKVDLPPGDRAAAVDDFGRPYKGGVTKYNLSAAIQQGSYGRRGEQGMYEAVGYALFNLAGVEAPRTHWVHWRIVDEAEESPADQYRGDFWGLYLADENVDGRFLKNHGLPDGNLFKMAGGGGELNHDGEGQPIDKSDLTAFLNAYNSKEQSEEWWRKNLDLPRYYSYRAIVECIHHYDIGDGKNYDYYRNPQTGRWQTVPWDLDLTWADHMYGSGADPFRDRVLNKPAFRVEYQNRLREVRDLLFNPEQAGALIDAHAGVLADPGKAAASILEADRRKWDFHPALGIGGQAGQGQFYQAGRTKDFPGAVQLMKDYVRTRGAWVDQILLNDPKIPATPTIDYVGEKSYPAAALRFAASPYKGDAPFAAVRWRIAEVTPAGAATATPRTPRLYEITPAWESDELPKIEPATIPAAAGVVAGHTYRVRVRVKDNANRWSHWSSPIEFKAS